MMKTMSSGLIVGLGLLALTSQPAQAKIVNFGSLSPTQRFQSSMKLSVGRQDSRYPKNDVMLPINVKLKNTTKHAYRYYFTQLYVNHYGIDGEHIFHRVHGPHRHVTVKAHSTKTVKKAFYENDQWLLGWVLPDNGTLTYLQYGKHSRYYVACFKNSQADTKKWMNRQHKYYRYQY